MSPSRARFVTACQQLLALGVVVVALAPATRVVSLDVVGVHPGQSAGGPSVGTPEVEVAALGPGVSARQDRPRCARGTDAPTTWFFTAHRSEHCVRAERPRRAG